MLGDDVMLMGDELCEHVITRAIDVFGLVLKDPVMVKDVGTYLQRTFGCDASIMSFGRAVRQVFYANPWVERMHYVWIAFRSNMIWCFMQ